MKFWEHRKFWEITFLVLILLLALAIRLYFLDLDYEIPGSDEGEYLIMAKSFSMGEIVFQWPYYRPFLLPFIWGLLGKLGFGVLSFKITLLIFSLSSILLVYLIGKDLFNYKAGLMAAFLLAFFSEEIIH